ncbi:unnamed protein product [Hermetia illucens]|uniref:Uncharacterized protein n=1 Tax=Hermetia illucens TaxID=343691 RepID=A0A7R8UZ39_HERIL|nr:unnamed protein product [Hermetia illucens]
MTDVVEKPPPSVKYGELKRQLTKDFADTNENRLSKVLTELELGGKKPSVLLRGMTSLAGDQLSSGAIKTLWLRRLPARVRAILTIDDRIETTILADMDDKILMECNSWPTISTVTSNERSQDNEAIVVDALTERFNKLERGFHNRNCRGFGSRNRYTRHRSKSNDKRKIYIYHERFGSKAQRAGVSAGIPRQNAYKIRCRKETPSRGYYATLFNGKGITRAILKRVCSTEQRILPVVDAVPAINHFCQLFRSATT